MAREVERVIDLNKPVTRAEKALVGKQVTFNIYTDNKREDLKAAHAIGSSTLVDRDQTTYLCSNWDKSFKEGSWLTATITGVTSRKNGVLVENLVALSDCTKASRPQLDPNETPTQAKDLEAAIKAAKVQDRNRLFEDQFVAIKVLKHNKESKQSFSFTATKQRKGEEFSVSYDCRIWDKSFKVGATVYGTLKEVLRGIDDNDIGVALTDCSTKR